MLRNLPPKKFIIWDNANYMQINMMGYLYTS